LSQRTHLGLRLRKDSFLSTIEIAIVQQPPAFLDLSGSVSSAECLIRKAAVQGAMIVVFPEAWLPGYPVWLDQAPGAALWNHPPAAALFRRLFDDSLTLDGPEIASFRKLAAELGVEIVLGCHERRGASLYNSVVRLARDAAPVVHRKIMPTHGERLLWAAADGSTLNVWESPHGLMGALICWEHWMPLARAAMHAQHEAVHFALWPALGELHLLNSRHYAFEGQCFVVAAGCVLTRDDVLAGFDAGPPDPIARAMLEAIPAEKWLLKAGGSAVIGPDGSVIASAGSDPVTLHATIDLDRLAEGRMLLDTAGHYSRPDIFELSVDRCAAPGVRFTDPS